MQYNIVVFGIVGDRLGVLDSISGVLEGNVVIDPMFGLPSSRLVR